MDLNRAAKEEFEKRHIDRDARMVSAIEDVRAKEVDQNQPGAYSLRFATKGG